ncbi:hypothetical protein GCM10009525_08560 [Streptosporangium amethystogenes subsp. fukuiense]
MAGAGAVLGVLGAVFTVIGLEQADRLASVLGVFIGLAGLGVSVYGLRHPAGQAPFDHGVASPAGIASSLPGPAVRHGESPGSAAEPAGPAEPAESAGPTGPAGPAEPVRPPAPRSEVARRYGGDHMEFHGGTFHGPVTGKSVGRQGNGPGDDGST